MICKWEISNCYDTHAMAIMKTIEEDIKMIGHIPRKISAIWSILIRCGGSIVFVINGSRKYLFDLPQGGLEIPCILKFVTSNLNEACKMRQQLESRLHTRISSCTGTTMSSSKVNGPYSLLIHASYFISYSIHARFASVLSIDYKWC